MRSQVLHPLVTALLVTSSLGLYACDDNVVGGFEDGGGGAGGTGSTTAASDAADSSGSTSDATSSSSGTPDDLPDYGFIELVETGDSIDGTGAFEFGRNPDPECETTIIDDCWLAVCGEVEGERSLSAGVISITGTSSPLTMDINDNTGWYSTGVNLATFTASPVTFSASGDVVPPFVATAPAPPRVEGLSVDSARPLVAIDEDLTVTWTNPSGDAGLVRMLFYRVPTSDEGPLSVVSCGFDATAGAGTVPHELLSANPEARPGIGYVAFQHLETVSAGTFQVDLITSREFAYFDWAAVCADLAPFDDDELNDCATSHCCDELRVCGQDPSSCFLDGSDEIDIDRKEGAALAACLDQASCGALE